MFLTNFHWCIVVRMWWSKFIQKLKSKKSCNEGAYDGVDLAEDYRLHEPSTENHEANHHQKSLHRVEKMYNLVELDETYIYDEENHDEEDDEIKFIHRMPRIWRHYPSSKDKKKGGGDAEEDEKAKEDSDCGSVESRSHEETSERSGLWVDFSKSDDKADDDCDQEDSHEKKSSSRNLWDFTDDVC